MNRLNRGIAIILTMVMLLSCFTAMAEEQTNVTIEKTPIYFFDSTDLRYINTAYFTEAKDIPYFSVNTAADILRLLGEMFGDTNYTIEDGYYTYGELEAAGMLSIENETDKDVSVYVLKRENGSFVVFDSDSDMIWMSDRDLFFVSSYAVSGGDVVSADGIQYVDEDHTQTTVKLYKRANGNQFVREGDVTSIYLNDYDIGYEIVDGTMYLPAATISDLILPGNITFNGEALFYTYSDLNDTAVNDDGETMLDLYYKPGAHTRSEDLIYFNYCELCLMLDQCYGLMSEHGIKNGFQQYFIETGLSEKLLSSDISVYTEAMNELFFGYFGDLHSGLKHYSPYSGGEVSLEGKNKSVSLYESSDRGSRFASAREAAGITTDGQILEGYSEIGDTAFITFDSFKGASQNYYSDELWSDLQDIYMSDTISLVIYAQKMIHREDSPIKKVVIDLSCNGGGSVDACVYVAAWVLGAATLSIENVRTGAQYSTNYWVDTNLDGRCTTKDDLDIDNLDVYCLISGNSFSCGNLLPAIFKEDGRVTLVGQTSGGGSCIVRSCASADGTMFQVSDYLRMSIVKNGSFYGIDEGVEPDIPLRKCASYYDREGLMEYLSTFR